MKEFICQARQMIHFLKQNFLGKVPNCVFVVSGFHMFLIQTQIKFRGSAF